MAYTSEFRGPSTGLAGLWGDFMTRLRLAREAQTRYRTTYEELSSLTDRELADIGLHRDTLEEVARQASNMR